MPGPTPCPIFDIERGLSTHIHSREETLRIRRSLSNYLVAALRSVNDATKKHLNHECPYNFATVSTNPPGIKSTRMAYLNALRARNAAQMRHRELKASLEELQNRHIIESPTENDSQYDNEVTRCYMTLLRQRRRLTELQVIQESLEKLLNADSAHGPKDPKTIVKDAIGEQPDPPAARLDTIFQSHDEEALMLKLKKEVLEAKTSMDRATLGRLQAESESQAKPRLEEQVYALSRARDEIVDWVQTSLAKMEEESEFIEDASPVKRSTEDTVILDLASSEIRIRGSYNQYTASRSAVIESYECIQHTPTAMATTTSGSQGYPQVSSQEREPPDSAGIIKRVLPYLPCFSRIDKNERALLQQVVYLQTQIAAADEEITESLLRLSGESHILPSGSKGMGCWERTAAEVETATGAFVKEGLLASRQEVSNVSTIVDLCTLQSRVLSSN